MNVLRRYFNILLYILLALPSTLWATELQTGQSSFSFLASFLQMLFALLVVLGLILATYYGANRFLKNLPGIKQHGRYIRVVESRAMGPGKSLFLVEVSGEYLLLSSSEKGIHLVKKINMLEDIEILDDPSTRTSFFSFLQKSSAE